MSNDSIILLTKDALAKAYLPCYGNKDYKGKTPNLDALVEKGTKFNAFFTAAPSSSMSYLSMFTGKYPYEQEMKTYIPLLAPYKGETLFDRAYQKGFSCHVMWDEHWFEMAYIYTRCYGQNTIMHYIDGLRQAVGPHIAHSHEIVRNDRVAQDTLSKVENEVKAIMSSNNKVFLWCHLPHVLNGRTGYCDDIDLYDQYIGMFRKYFADENIFISSDHGNMNGHRGKIRYGFDVYDTAINIPLITPRINDLRECNDDVCNVDIERIIFDRIVPLRDVVFSESTYYAQPRRKLAVVWKNYRYIYNKETNSEELYDIETDPNEEFSLMEDRVYDPDRNVYTISKECYFYKKWEDLPEIRNFLRGKKNIIWRDVSAFQKIWLPIRDILIKIYVKKLYPFIKGKALIEK